MTNLSVRLDNLGLSQYFDALVLEGFDTWDTLLDITESDLTYLKFKLGHRRKLQRAIAESRGQPADRALVDKLAIVDGAYRSDDSGTDRRDRHLSPSHASQAAASNTGTKRKYRRHPKPDPSAPERPPSAYVIFSNQVREDLKGQELSFTEIAKVVGERWQILAADKRENFEQQANSAKERYYSAMSNYKKTSDYAQYQAYLLEFKAKHGTTRTEGKRSKVETETSSLSEPTLAAHESEEKLAVSKSAPTLMTEVSRSSASSPSNVTPIYGLTHRRPSPSSSAVWSESVNSPVRQDPYSPEQSPTVLGLSASARDYRATTRRIPSRLLTQDSQYAAPAPASAGQYPTYRPNEAWTSAEHLPPSYMTALPQRDARISARVPELTRQDSTLSSAGSSQPQTSPSHLLPPMDISKVVDRRLPQPIITSGPGPRQTSLDHRPPLPMMKLAATDHARHSGHGSEGPPDQRAAWPALLQATNLAREAEIPGPKSKKSQNTGSKSGEK